MAGNIMESITTCASYPGFGGVTTASSGNFGIFHIVAKLIFPEMATDKRRPTLVHLDKLRVLEPRALFTMA
jgi:hypothetical protein